MEITKIRKASKKQIETKIANDVGANLYDIIPLIKTKPNFSAETVEVAEEIKTIFAMLNTAVDLSLKLRDGDVKADTKSLVESALLDVKKKVGNIVMSEDITFPDDLVDPMVEENKILDKIGIDTNSMYFNRYLKDYFNNGSSVLSKHVQAVTKLSKIAVSDIINIVDKMNLVLIPGDFLKDNSVDISTHKSMTEDALRAFTNMFDGVFGKQYYYYVACPINHYSFYNHIESDSCILPVYTKNFMTEFTTIALQIPTIKGMKTQIESLKERFDIMESDQAHIKQSIEALSSQVKRLDQIAKSNQQQIIMQSNKIQSLLHTNADLSSIRKNLCFRSYCACYS